MILRSQRRYQSTSMPYRKTKKTLPKKQLSLEEASKPSSVVDRLTMKILHQKFITALEHHGNTLREIQNTLSQLKDKVQAKRKYNRKKQLTPPIVSNVPPEHLNEILSLLKAMKTVESKTENKVEAPGKDIIVTQPDIKEKTEAIKEDVLQNNTSVIEAERKEFDKPNIQTNNPLIDTESKEEQQEKKIEAENLGLAASG